MTPTSTPTITPTDTPITPNPVTPYPGYLDWPRNDQRIINSSFGEYRSNHYHLGVDMLGGSEQFATASVNGTIIDRKFYLGVGNVVSMLDSNGYLINYLHLSDTGFLDEFPDEGEVVTVGTPIGRIGNTGGTSGYPYPYHLHFEIRSVLPTPGPNYRNRADAYNPLSRLDPPWTPTPTSGNRPSFLMNLYVIREVPGAKSG